MDSPQLRFTLWHRGEALARLAWPFLPQAVAEPGLGWMVQSDCVFMTVVLSKGRISSTKQYCSGIWIVFYGSSEAFCPLLKAVLETLIKVPQQRM